MQSKAQPPPLIQDPVSGEWVLHPDQTPCTVPERPTSPVTTEQESVFAVYRKTQMTVTNGLTSERPFRDMYCSCYGRKATDLDLEFGRPDGMPMTKGVRESYRKHVKPWVCQRTKKEKEKRYKFLNDAMRNFQHWKDLK